MLVQDIIETRTQSRGDTDRQRERGAGTDAAAESVQLSRHDLLAKFPAAAAAAAGRPTWAQSIFSETIRQH